MAGFPADFENFLGAIQMGQGSNAIAMLEADTNLVHDQFQSRRALLEAAAAGNLPMVKRLLELGADINESGDTLSSGGAQKTALHWAIYRNHPEVCKFLLEAGADPNAMASGFETPLHLAFSENHEEMAGWLLDYGANPFQGKLFVNDETTPFELDITKSDGKLVPRMLGQETKNPLGAKSFQKPRHSKRLPRGAKTPGEVLSAHGGQLLLAAVTRGELEAARALFQAGVTIKNSAPTNFSLMQSFALASADAAKSRLSTIDQWHQAQERFKVDDISQFDPQVVASLDADESRLAAKVESLDPERRHKILELLIQHGADYDAFSATAMDDTNQMSRLVAKNKNVAQSRDCNGETPLHWAVKSGQLPLVSFWIQAGADLGATNFAGQTALHIAAATGKTGIVKTLLAAKAPTKTRDTNGWTPLDAAIHAKQSDSIHLLLGQKSAPSHPERGLAITLHEAAATGNIAALAALLETETNLEARNELGLTPLQVAVTKGHLAAAAMLVDKGANVNARDPDGNSLLHEISLQDRFTVYDRPPTNWLANLKANPDKEIYITNLTVGQYEQGPNPVLQGTSFLLACGVDPRATNHAGQTVMQLITDNKISRSVFFFDNDREKLLKLLRDAGGKIDRRDADGNTALHRLANSVDANEVDRMAGIIAAGADVNATNNLGQTPLHKAAEKIWGWDGNDPPVNEPLQLLIYKKANVNAQDNEGRTPLHILAAADTSFKKEATELLLRSGANPNLRDKHGRTPAHIFLSGNWPWEDASECIQLLVKAGADLSAKDDEGKTPLHDLVSLGNEQPMFFLRGIGEVFLSAKVDLNARDNDGNTPLIIAAKTGTMDVYAWLLDHGANQDATNHLGQTAGQLLSSSEKTDLQIIQRAEQIRKQKGTNQPK